MESPNASPSADTGAGNSTSAGANLSLTPTPGKLPTLERKVDHLNTIVTTVCVVTFLPAPLLLAFGPKAFFWMGIVVCIVAVIRLINSPVQLQQAQAPVADSVSAAVRQRQSPSEIAKTATSGNASR